MRRTLLTKISQNSLSVNLVLSRASTFFPVVGIDPGVRSCALAVIHNHKARAHAFVCTKDSDPDPVDLALNEIGRWDRQGTIRIPYTIAFVEKPGGLKGYAIEILHTVGVFTGFLIAKGYPVRYLNPSSWRAFLRIPKGEDPDQILAKELGLDLEAFGDSKLRSHAIDALAIAWVGYLLICNERR
jgi:hypothetical protein